jgi:hypothetical protein
MSAAHRRSDVERDQVQAASVAACSALSLIYSVPLETDLSATAQRLRAEILKDLGRRLEFAAGPVLLTGRTALGKRYEPVADQGDTPGLDRILPRVPVAEPGVPVEPAHEVRLVLASPQETRAALGLLTFAQLGEVAGTAISMFFDRAVALAQKGGAA